MSRAEKTGLSNIFVGKAHIFGEHVSTDEILPGKYLDRPYSEVGQFAMAGVDERFSSTVEPGDVIVAGHNFGCGSSREAAVIALKAAGISAVIAPSFARIFLRNAVNNGLVPIVVSSVDGFRAGDRVEVNLERRTVRVVEPGRPPGGDSDQPRGDLEWPILNLKGISAVILQIGGIVEFTRRKIKNAQLGGGSSVSDEGEMNGG